MAKKEETKEIKRDKNYFRFLDTMAKGLFNIVFRSGPIEDYHAEGCPIGDKEMEVLNRYGFNCMGYMLDLLFRGDMDKFMKICGGEAIFLSYFDPLDFNSKEVKQLEETFRLIEEELKEHK
jgi:hypothetical protein